MPVTGGEIKAAGPFFALVDDAKIRGGLHSVATVAERDAIDGSDFDKVGMLVFSQDTGFYYQRTAGGWSIFTGAGGGGGSAGVIRITDFLPQTDEAISDKVFQDPPNNTVLQSATASAGTIRVRVFSSHPIVDVGSTVATLPPSADGGHYEGNVSISASAGTVTAKVIDGDGAIGAEDNAELAIAAAPEILTLSFTAGYPGSQTELKAGDTFQITGTLDAPGTHVEVINAGAGTGELIAIGGPTSSFTVSMTIADRGDSAQALPATVRARDAAGAFGATRDTDEGGGVADGVDLITLNNLYPSVSFGAVSYPASQQALKDAESATVPVTSSDLDSVAYTSPGSELTITNPNTDEATKTVSRIAGGYNVSTDNLRATAVRDANGAQTVADALVAIAHDAAAVSVIEPSARLVSGGNDGTAAQDHEITLASDQSLSAAPTIDAGSGGGTWQGAGFTGGPATWTRDLRVHDDDIKTVYSWTNLNAVNLAGRVTSVVTGDATYELGGFVARTLTFAPFASGTVMDVLVSDFAKLQAGIFTATNQPALKQAIGTGPVVTDGWTINSAGIDPTTVIWLDTPAANSNSSGTATITDVEELP